MHDQRTPIIFTCLLCVCAFIALVWWGIGWNDNERAQAAAPDGQIMPMCGFKRGNDIVALQCELTIKDGKPEWNKAK